MDRSLDEPIEVVAYDVRWQAWFEADAQEIQQALGSKLKAIEHFGSTAVPNLASKAIIDILVAPDLWPLDPGVQAGLEAIGYHYFGEAGVPGREYFRRRIAHATNLAVVQSNARLWHDNLAIRDYLIAHPEAARRYGAAKRAAWAGGARTLLEYSSAKSDFVVQLLAAAQSWRVNAILQSSENLALR